jgi:hypothetical protein
MAIALTQATAMSSVVVEGDGSVDLTSQPALIFLE